MFPKLAGTPADKIADLLFRLNRDHGTSLVIVTHDEQLALRCARRLHLDSGKLQVNETSHIRTGVLA